MGNINIFGALTASGAAALGGLANNINISGGLLNIGTTGGAPGCCTLALDLAPQMAR